MKVDFKELKKEISLPDFFVQLGWDYAEGCSSHSPKFTNGVQTVVIKKNKEGEYTYWDVHDESIRGKSIIDLMQQHLYDETGKQPTLREAGEAIQQYVENGIMISPQNSKFGVSNAELEYGQLAKLSHELKPYNGDFLAKRGINQETLSSPVFSGTFYSREYIKDKKKYNNTCVKLVNSTGFQGISQRGIRNDSESFKGILGNKYGSIVVSNYDKSRPIDHIYIGESMIDCASHYQMKLLNTNKNLLYLSTEGNITSGQMELIKLLLAKQSINNIANHLTYIFDNDKNGYKYALKLNAYLQGQEINTESLTVEELKEKVLQLPNAELSINSDWNDDLIMKLSNDFQEAIKKCDFVQLAKFKDEGYSPSSEVIEGIRASVSKQTVIILQKIFNLPLDNIEMNIKPIQNQEKSFLKEHQQEL